VHYRHKLVFFWRFSRPRGGMHYATIMTVYITREVFKIWFLCMESVVIKT
jgi:hypothetical protein